MKEKKKKIGQKLLRLIYTYAIEALFIKAPLLYLKNLKSEKPYLGYLRTLECRVWLHIPKEKARRSWMTDPIKVFIFGYEGN